MSTKAIPLEALRTALMCAVVKRRTAGHEINGKPHARAAAYTHYAPVGSPTCRTPRSRRSLRTVPGAHFGLMERGELDRLIDRVRLEHGLPEVRRTWGLGLRALQAALGNGVMR